MSQAEIPQKSTFLRLFEEWRVRMRLTEDDAAERIGYSRSYIQKIKAEKIKAGDKAVTRLADELRRERAAPIPPPKPIHTSEMAAQGKAAEEAADYLETPSEAAWLFDLTARKKMARKLRAAANELDPPGQSQSQSQ